MTYVMSDLHGMCGKYFEMLDKIGAGDGDKIYILGDVIDRGRGSDAILLSMMDDWRIVPILGNHEFLALPVLKALCDGKPFGEIEKTKAYRAWVSSGGGPTSEAFRSRGRDVQRKMVDYIGSFRIYEEIETAGGKFHLSHTLPEFDPSRGVHDVTLREFILGEPDYDIRYDPDMTFVTGHTPTEWIDPSGKGRVRRGSGHIAVDCGAAFGGKLGCICLETTEEFYV